MLTNHRSDWLLPRLNTFGITGRFEGIWVSDKTGFIKPEAAAFDPVFQYRDTRQKVLFVDDQPHNVLAAEVLGIPGIRAMPDGRWLDQVCRWLETDDDCIEC